jgi:N-ethylmaleimide reductase
MTDLFTPVRLGNLNLPSRIVMAPLTRSRAGRGDIPGPMNAEYYAQRADAALIVSEATQVSQQGKGYAYTPAIETPAQAEGWRLVTRAVHARGGRIFLQLWHVGRISHPSLQPRGGLPVAPSAIRAAGQAFTEDGFKPFETPRPLRTDEMAGIVAQYRNGAALAREAGFDGVEIHGANGYLIDQFLRDRTNWRTDRYGGTLANRLRLLVEVVEAVTDVWGGARTGLRIAPVSPANDIADSQPERTFFAAVEAIDRFELGYLHVVEGATQGSRDIAAFDYAGLRRRFRGLYMANNGYDLAMANAAVAAGRADLIAFGRPYIANPDLVERLRIGAALAEPDRATLYGGDAHGYTDYPPLTPAEAAAAAE